MGFPPPPNAPDLPQQAATSAELAFPPAPTGPELCGFEVPGFTFNVSFSLPPLPTFDFPPELNFALPLNCDLANAFPEVSGGGRKPNPPPPDPEFGI